LLVESYPRKEPARVGSSLFHNRCGITAGALFKQLLQQGLFKAYRKMEMDLNSLEVKIEYNEFDNCCEETVEHSIDDDEEMKIVADEKENGESLEGPANLEGTSERTHEDLRLKINRSKESHEGRKNDGRRNGKDRHSCGITTRKPGSSSRRKHRYEGTERRQRLYQPLDASPDLDPKILGREIAYRLGEKKVSLIVKVVRVLGFKCAMQILDDTRKIEKQGGMLTMDGARRREPGGVYICCLKERGYATKKELDDIFKDDREKNERKSKAQKTRANGQEEERNGGPSKAKEAGERLCEEQNGCRGRERK